MYRPRQGGEGEEGPVVHTQEGGVRGGKMLKLLFRGWWMKGVCSKGCRIVGCREEPSIAGMCTLFLYNEIQS